MSPMEENQPNIAAVGHADFQRLVIDQSRQRPVLVDFWADWCSPCRVLMPLLGRLADEYAGKFFLAKVDTEQERDLAAEWQVRSLPTVKLFTDGRVVDEFMGALPEGEVRRFLERHIPRASDGVMARARELFEGGDRDQGLVLARQALADDPENDRLPLQLLEMLVAAEHYAEAGELIGGMSLDLRQSREVKAFESRVELATMADAPADLDELERLLAARPGDTSLRYDLAAAYAGRQRYAEAMADFLEVVRQDRTLHDDGARKALLKLFEVVDDPQLVQEYRRKLAAALY